MRRMILSILFFMVSSGATAADLRPLADVIPEHHLGSIKVVAPDLGLSLDSDYSINLLLQGGGQVRIGELNRNYLVAEQTAEGFCLEVIQISYRQPTLRGGRFCGFSLRRGELLQIELKAFQISAKDTYSVKIGPMMSGELTAKPAGAKLWSKFANSANSFLQFLDFKITYIAPVGTIGFATSCSSLVLNNCSSRKEFVLDSSLKLPIVFDVTPPDFRQSISLKIWEKPGFPIALGSHMVLAGFRNPKGGFYSLPDSIDSPVQSIGFNTQSSWINAGSIMSQIIYFLSSGDQFLKVFPVDSKEAVYTLDLNGYSYPFSLDGRRELEPLNVANFAPGGLNGSFSLSRRSIKEPSQWVPVLCFSENTRNGPSLFPEVCKFQTGTSVMVARGFIYKVVSYIMDGSGRSTEQSSHEIDLTGERKY